MTIIGAYVFAGCTGLTSVTIRNSVTSIGDYAFRGCSGLTSPIYTSTSFAYLPTSYSGSYSIPNGIKKICGGAFYGCSGLPSVTIPGSVTSIGSSAFYGCSGLTSVTIPGSVTNIGSSAFYGCKNLEKVYSLIKEPFDINENVFEYYDKGDKFTSATLCVPVGTKKKYQVSDGWKNFTSIVEEGEVPEGDVNGDHTVDVADIATVISVMARKDNNNTTADVNGDGVVDVADIATIISIMAGGGSSGTVPTEGDGIDYVIDYSRYNGFPFYVMGYVPEWIDGVMTDLGANYKYAVVEGAEETSDVIVMAQNGVKYYRIELTKPEWHQYFIADGIKTQSNGSYIIRAMVKASQPVTIKVNMGWGWGDGQQLSASVTIPTKWTEVEWEYSGIGGSSCNLVAQPGTSTAKIEWKWVAVYHI